MFRRLSGVGLLALAACATTTTAAVVAVAPPIMQLGPKADVTPEQLLAINSMCRAEGPATAAAPDIKLSPGMGTGGFRVDSTKKEAQDWFDFGLALSHAFYHADAIVAMKKSVEADPTCSTCMWGLAWSQGPTLNYGINKEQTATALESAKKAKALAKPGDARAMRLADAMIARYDLELKASPEPAFGKALKEIGEAYPDEHEITVLATHSLLIPFRAGDRSGLKPALAMLEAVLKDHPADTGAIHYYIHATEFDGRAEDALPYADKLGELAPAASHLVHMPAHTFFHAGRYQDAAVVNAKAIGADSDWLDAGGEKNFPGAAPSLSRSLPPYYSHNLAFGLAGALMSGDAQLALKFAEHASIVYPESDPATVRSYPVSRTWVALGRYAPDRLLAMTLPTGNPRYDTYSAYARGEALLIKGDAKGVRAEMDKLSKMTLAGGGARSAETFIALSVLDGRLALAADQPKRAIQMFRRAAEHQEAQFSGSWDPPTWWYPVRRSLAAAHLKAGEHAKAEAEAKKSLSKWKHDPLALWVLGKAQVAQGRTAEGEGNLAEARKLWRGDFDTITVEAI